MDLTPI